jgi:hypothetical protein
VRVRANADDSVEMVFKETRHEENFSRGKV